MNEPTPDPIPDPIPDPTPDPTERSDRTRPDQTADDTDVGWGERPADGDDALRRLLEERPPHHGDV